MSSLAVGDVADWHTGDAFGNCLDTAAVTAVALAKHKKSDWFAAAAAADTAAAGKDRNAVVESFVAGLRRTDFEIVEYWQRAAVVENRKDSLCCYYCY